MEVEKRYKAPSNVEKARILVTSFTPYSGHLVTLCPARTAVHGSISAIVQGGHCVDAGQGLGFRYFGDVSIR